ncbi:hypothetical protein D3C86_1388980 [compost metagenome]
MQPHGRHLARIAQRNHRGHRRAGGKPRQIDLVRAHVGAARQFIDQHRHGLRLAATFAGGKVEPLPAPMHRAPQRLLRIGDDKALALGQRVHARAGCEIFRGLLAAVKHHHHGQRALGAGWNIETVRELRHQFARQWGEAELQGLPRAGQVARRGVTRGRSAAAGCWRRQVEAPQPCSDLLCGPELRATDLSQLRLPVRRQAFGHMKTPAHLGTGPLRYCATQHTIVGLLD